MNTKPTPEQIKEISAALNKMWLETITTVSITELEDLANELMSDPEVAFMTQKRLIACGMICFSKGELEFSDDLKKAAYMLCSFRAIAEKKVVDGKAV